MKRVAVVGVLAASVLAGCGDDDPQTHVVTGIDFAYERFPDAIAAGDVLEFRNDSDSEIHELVAFRLDDDDTRTVEELVALPPDELLALVGPEPATVLITPPGGDQIAAVGDGTIDEPGRYAVICVIPTGADPDDYLAASAASAGGPPDIEGGAPHVANGMYAEFTVES